MLPKPEPIELEEIEWLLVLVNGEDLVALSPEEFAKYQRNQVEILRYVRQADVQIDHYREELER